MSIFTTVTVETPITTERVTDLLCNAFEGGSNYWMHWDLASSYKMMLAQQEQPAAQFPQYDFDHPHWRLSVIVTEEENCRYDLTRDRLVKGLSLFSEKGGYHFKDFLQENDDAMTADVFLQLCLFGNVVYG